MGYSDQQLAYRFPGNLLWNGKKYSFNGAIVGRWVINVMKRRNREHQKHVIKELVRVLRSSFIRPGTSVT